jgi:hypothetical protein
VSAVDHHDTLPPGIRSRRVANLNGLEMQALEAGH